jgi:hypothetical protein
VKKNYFFFGVTGFFAASGFAVAGFLVLQGIVIKLIYKVF